MREDNNLLKTELKNWYYKGLGKNPGQKAD